MSALQESKKVYLDNNHVAVVLVEHGLVEDFRHRLVIPCKLQIADQLQMVIRSHPCGTMHYVTTILMWLAPAWHGVRRADGYA